MQVNVLNDGLGKPVDWWFIYKLPRAVGPGNHTTGDEFLYCDSTWGSELHLSKNKLNDDKNALTATLRQLFSVDSTTGYILWNDEIPPTKSLPRPSNNRAKGHSKGVLAFNKKANCGFYLLHSTPRFPAVGEIELPEDEREYGQTFLCVSLTFATSVQIAEILRLHHEPQVYASKNLPEDLTSPLVNLVHQNSHSLNRRQPLVADFSFRSKEQNDFRLFAKHRKWSEPTVENGRSKDFWNHLVGPALRDNMDVETWRRGKVFENVIPGTNRVTLDVLGVNLQAIGYGGYQWPFTKDHAKWGSTEHRPAGLLLRHPGYVVIADINRDESQARRGGGGLAFQHDGIWKALRSVEKVDSAVQKTTHRMVKN